MAEFLNQKKPKKLNSPPDSGFNAMGKPIPYERRAGAAKHLIEMGVDDVEERFMCIERVSNCLRHDKIHEAIGEAMKFVDLTGAYRLMAVLLTD